MQSDEQQLPISPQQHPQPRSRSEEPVKDEPLTDEDDNTFPHQFVYVSMECSSG